MRVFCVENRCFDFPDTCNILRDQPWHGWFSIVVADENAVGKQRVSWFNSYNVISVAQGDNHGRPGSTSAE